MVTMVDELYDRQYQDGREQMNAALVSAFSRLGHAVREAFEVLVKIEYQSPWTVKSRKVRSN
jgi:hypothetical protein